MKKVISGILPCNQNIKINYDSSTTMVTYVLDIDAYVDVIENEFKPFMPLPKDVVFIKQYRDPIYGKKRAVLSNLSSDMVAHTPFHPFLCINFLKEALCLLHYSKSDDIRLFVENPLMEFSKSFLEIEDMFLTIRELIDRYLNEQCSPNIIGSYVNMYPQSADVITNAVLRIYDEIACFIKPYMNNIISLDTSTSMYILQIREDISAFRFKEYCNREL